LKDLTERRRKCPLVSVLQGEIVDPPPIWLMRQAGRYLPEYRERRAKAGGFVELCLDPVAAAEVTLQPLRRFDFDAAIIFSDILIVPHALGAKLWFEDGEGPRLEPLRDRMALAKIKAGLDRNIVDRVYEAISRVRTELAPKTALIGFCGAPWTVATYWVAGRGTKDHAAARGLAADEPTLFTEIIDRLIAATADHLIGQLQAGANVVQIFDTWAGVLDPEGFERWCLQPTIEIIRRVRSAKRDALIIVFPKGVSISQAEHLVRASGAHAVGLDSDADRALACKHLQPLCAIQGNLEPGVLVEGGAVLDHAVDRIKADFRGARHIFNLGHGILPQTPIAHVERMIARVRNK
jgi:uroporphyrinogen decarboxylase